MGVDLGGCECCGWCLRVSVCWCVRDDSVGLCASPLGGNVRPYRILDEVFMHLD